MLRVVGFLILLCATLVALRASEARDYATASFASLVSIGGLVLISAGKRR